MQIGLSSEMSIGERRRKATSGRGVCSANKGQKQVLLTVTLSHPPGLSNFSFFPSPPPRSFISREISLINARVPLAPPPAGFLRLRLSFSLISSGCLAVARPVPFPSRGVLTGERAGEIIRPQMIYQEARLTSSPRKCARRRAHCSPRRNTSAAWRSDYAAGQS